MVKKKDAVAETAKDTTTAPAPDVENGGSFPNGNETLPEEAKAFYDYMFGRENPWPTTAQLVDHWNRFQKKSAEGVLVQGMTVFRASKLYQVELAEFCSKVGFSQESPTFVKWCKIGEQANRFLPILDRMPPTWTTFYKLAKMKPEVFRKVTSSDTFGPKTTADEIDLLVGKKPKAKGAGAGLGRDVVIDLSGLDELKKREALAEVCALAEKLGFKAELADTFARKLAPKSAVPKLADFLRKAA